jgi:hypothetical protein
MKNIILNTILLVLIGFNSNGQGSTLRVLFLGNSFTSANNLPQITYRIASSVGDSLIFDSNMPGGYSLVGHAKNNSSLSKIMLKNWDYVVLQEGIGVYLTTPSVYSYDYSAARTLNKLVNIFNPNCETMVYMPWGRKFGCCPYLPCDGNTDCTYEDQDEIMYSISMATADTIEAPVSPVGAVWRYLIENHPDIELYQTDLAHPSPTGSYAAACCFYTTLFKKDPSLISYNLSLNDSIAEIIKKAVKTVVYDNLTDWRIDKYPKDPCCKTLTTTLSDTLIEPAKGILTLNIESNSNWYLSIDKNWLKTINANNLGTGNKSLTLAVDANEESKIRTALVTIYAEGVQPQTITITQKCIPASNQMVANETDGYRLCPNPAKEEFYITGIQSTNATTTIYDESGHQVLTRQVSEGETVNIKMLSSGIYVVILVDGNRLIRKKLIKKVL